MNSDFANYKHALAIKELNYDEPCFGKFDNYQNFDICSEQLYTSAYLSEQGGFYLLAPLKSQVFRWFEKEHSMFIQRTIETNVNEILGIHYSIVSWRFAPIEIVFENPYDCFDKDKAESFCIDKLIDIVKNKK